MPTSIGGIQLFIVPAIYRRELGKNDYFHTLAYLADYKVAERIRMSNLEEVISA